MVDVILLAEVAWCSLFVGQQHIRKALVYGCGMMVAGYVSGQVSGWLARTLVPPSSPAFHWLTKQISAISVQQPVISQYIPAEYATGGMPASQWIAYHVVEALFYVVFTLATMALFLVGALVYDALWDQPERPRTTAQTVFSSALGVSCGVYVAGLTAVLLANLSWLGTFGHLSPMVTSSLGVDWVGRLLSGR